MKSNITEDELTSKIQSYSKRVFTAFCLQNVRRPLSAYHHFYRFHKELVYAKSKTSTKIVPEMNDDVTLNKNQMRKEIGLMWKKATKARKAQFKTIAKREKKQFQGQMRKLPSYTYVDHAKESINRRQFQRHELTTSRQPIKMKTKILENQQMNNTVDSNEKIVSIEVSTRIDHHMDLFGIKWSIAEREMLKQISSFLESLSDESFMRIVDHNKTGY